MTATLTPAAADVFAYDRHQNPIDFAEYSRLRRDPDYRVLHRDTAAGLEVVTVWLGLDQGPFSDAEGPLIYGTAILDPGSADQLWDNYERFAATDEEATANHQAALHSAATRDIAAGR